MSSGRIDRTRGDAIAKRNRTSLMRAWSAGEGGSDLPPVAGDHLVRPQHGQLVTRASKSSIVASPGRPVQLDILRAHRDQLAQRVGCDGSIAGIHRECSIGSAFTKPPVTDAPVRVSDT